MAARKPNPNIEGHAAQFGDLSREGQRGTRNLMAATGDAPTRVRTEIDRLTATPNRSRKMDVTLESLKHAAPGIQKRSVTLSNAAGHRNALYESAVADAPEGGEPRGAGWYFNHHGSLHGMASKHGYGTDVAITASAVMSPNNGPENELAATNALMEAHRQHTVAMTPQLHAALGKDAPHKDFIGQHVKFSDLPTHTVAAMSATDLRSMVQTSARDREGRDQSFHLMTQISRGGTKGNISKAVSVLRGETHPDDAIDPHSAPKVWSYRNATRNAVPNSPEHVEYMSRVGSHATGNEAFDLYGLRQARHGILDPEGHTAEDTWMNSITSGQRLAQLPTNRRGRASGISPAKTYGSAERLGALSVKTDPTTGSSVDPDPRLGPSAIQHAFNNRATHMAAARASRGTGFHLPAVAMQEVPWTQARVEAGADTEHNARMAAASARPEQPHTTGQLDMFTGQLSRPRDAGHFVQPASTPHLSTAQFGHAEEPTGPERGKAEAAASAIHRNTMTKRRRQGRSTDTSAKALGNEPYEGWG